MENHTCTSSRCQHPWLRRKNILGFSSFYELTPHRTHFFKLWKKSGPARSIHQILFDFYDGHWPFLDLNFDRKVLIPIPHDFHRAWNLKGSTSERLAQEVSKRLKIPVLKILIKSSETSHTKRQAQKRGQDRTVEPPCFEVSPSEFSPNSTLGILMDDFRTTGSTVFAAALALEEKGWQNLWIHHLAIKRRSWA